MDINELELLCKKVAADGFQDKKAAIAVLSVIDLLRNTKAQRDDLLAAFIALHNQAYFIGDEYHKSDMCQNNIAIINSIKAKCEAQS